MTSQRFACLQGKDILMRQPTRSVAVMLIVLLTGTFIVPVAPAEELPRLSRELSNLVPSDCGVIVTVDNLRDQVREILSSRLARDFQNLPLVKAWFDSEKFQRFQKARHQIEGALEVKLTDIRDRIFGDAAILALRIPAGPAADSKNARGILIVKARDSALLKRLIERINLIQKQNGELASVVERKRDGTTYHIREFPPYLDRQPDAYVLFPDGTLAISNSEEQIQQVIDRKQGSPAGAEPNASEAARRSALEAASRRLPERALLRLYVDPRLARPLLKKASRPRSDGDFLIEKYVESLRSAGAALVVNSGRIELRCVEVFEPRKLEELLGRPPREPREPLPPLDRVPATTLAIVSLELDLPGLYQTCVQFVPQAERSRVESVETALKGIFLGQDLKSRILPGLGPRLLALIDGPADWKPTAGPDGEPGKNWALPSVLSIELRASDPADAGKAVEPRGPTVADAVDNALSTALALISLDRKHAPAGSRIVSREVGKVTVRTLDPPVPFASAVDREGHRLILSNSAVALEQCLAGNPDATGSGRFGLIRAAAFPDDRSFLCLDLAAVQNLIETHRDQIAWMLSASDQRPKDEVARDLDQARDLCRLFDAAYLTSRIDLDSTAVFHTLGLLPRNAGKNADAAPPRP